MSLLLPPAGRTAEIIINEVMANNDSIAPLDNYPEYTPDYVELYNTTPNPINLADGWTLSNKKFPLPIDNKDFFFFPPGTVIPGDSYLLVFFDDETNFPGIHTTFLAGGTNRETFTLSRTGDRVQLYKNHSDLVDSNIFGMQIPNHSIGRVPNFTGPFTLTVPSPCGGTIPCLSNAAAPFVTPPTGSNEMTLKINEWLALSQSGTNINRDWFEVYNPDTNIVLLSGLVFADLGTTNSFDLPLLRAVPPLSFIAPLGFAQIFCLGSGQGDADDPDEVDFSLSSSNGDGLFIFAPDRSTVIDLVNFGAFATANVSRGRLPDGGDPNPTPLPRLSPEESNFGNIPEIAINEILSHTDPPLEDAIELVNLSPTSQNISHWWLSNNRNIPRKYRIPNGTIIPAGGYMVFYEYQFNNSATAVEPFNLNSARGDECYLFKGDSNGRLLGFRRGLDFGPADNGVSFGRYVTSENNVDIVSMSDLSFGTTIRRGDDESFLPIFRTGTGAANPTPRVGPVVINEIHYHHPESLVDGVLTDDQLKEFIELYNSSSQSVPLFDPVFYGYADGRTNTWRLRDGVSFNFPPNITLAPGEFALAVKFDPSISANVTAFINAFPGLAGRVPGQVRLFGPYAGTLANGGDTIELQRPDAPQPPGRVDAGLVPYVVRDRVRYNDEAPWPTNTATAGPDGGGDSLQRISSYDYGNDVINWMAAEPTPGAFNTPTGVEMPSVVTHPRSLTVRVGRSATFTVSARGGQLQYQWLQHGTNIPGATSATLTRNNVSPEQAGPYQVIITNISGAVTSLIAELTVSSTIDNDRPTVTITYPGTFVLTNKAIDVRGTAGDKVGVNGVFFTINDSVNFLSATGSSTFKVWGSLVPPILAPGTNRVKAYSQDHAGNNSLTNERAYFLSVRSPLTLSTTGSGTVSGATNEQLLELGRNIPLTATPSPRHLFSNWVVTTNLMVAHVSTSPMLQYLMASNTAVTANFVPNPFYAVAGKFNGLFHETDPTNGVRHGASGFFTLTVTDRGTYTASLLSGGFKLSASGQLNLEGEATNTILRKGTNALVVTWAVDLNGSDTLTGTVSDPNPVAGWTAELNGDRALFNAKTNPCALAGKYTLLLPGLPHDMFVPGGHSYGTVSIDSNGVVSLKGYLSDKTSAAQKVPLSKDGQWPLYASLYSGKGSLLSWVGFSNRLTDDFHGLLNWSKPALPKAKHYPLGFATNEAEVVGARYAAPVGTTNKILQMSSGLLTLNGGNLPQDHTNSVTLGLSSKVTNNTPHKLSVTFTLSSGLFKGSFTPTNAGAKAVSFAGAVLQKGTNAAGYYLGTNQSGRVLLEAAP